MSYLTYNYQIVQIIFLILFCDDNNLNIIACHINIEIYEHTTVMYALINLNLP